MAGFDVALGVITLTGVAIKVVDCIQVVRKGLRSVGDELAALETQVSALRETSMLVESCYRPTAGASPKTESPTLSDPGSPNSHETRTDSRQLLVTICEECRGVIEELYEKLLYINGETEDESATHTTEHDYGASEPANGDTAGSRSPESRVVQKYNVFGKNAKRYKDDLKKYNRYRETKDDLKKYHSSLHIYQQALQIMQNVMAEEARNRDSRVLHRHLREVSRRLLRMHGEMQKSSPNNTTAGQSLSAAGQALKPRPIHLRKAVSDIYTGRTTQLELLQEYLTKPGPPEQRRVVIYGVGGSGKTEFCYKFVHENLESYWGVFFIDASTPERIEQTFKAIAEHAHCGETKTAVLYWLAGLEEPWILIIDNADDSKLELVELFPPCSRGHILVTTRNPEFKYHATVDMDNFHFERLEQAEATELLKKASGNHMPWEDTLARSITDQLGNLALAIVHAGRTIRTRLVDLRGYLAYYQRRLDELRRSGPKLIRDVSRDDAVTRVFATLEGCYQDLERRSLAGSESATDAVELLKLFAFFHNENISLEILRRAVLGPGLELEQRQRDDEEHRSDPLSQSTWLEWARQAPAALLEGLLHLRRHYYLPLPQVIRAGWADRDVHGNLEIYMDRIRLAMVELTNLSLILYNKHGETFKMHPLVHQWARERPDMRFADQCLWADAAERVLAASILLPPLGTGSEDDRYVVGLLPHAKHIQEHRERRSSGGGGGSLWLGHWLLKPTLLLLPGTLPTSIVGAERVRLSAKLSVLSVKSGRFGEAEMYLAEVVAALEAASLSPSQAGSARAAKAALAGVYFQLGQPARAAQLHEEVLAACETRLGSDHPDTLRAMARLGHARWLQGRYTEARRLQVPAVAAMEADEELGPRHPDTLDALDALGLTVAKFWHEDDFREAYERHGAALAGMRECHGPDHSRTLLTEQNHCRAAVLLGGRARIADAAASMDRVVSVRKRDFGAEHPLTLLAMVNGAVTKAALGGPENLEAAEALTRSALTTATRNFAGNSARTQHNGQGAGENDHTGVGEMHIGILFGQHVLASILARRGNWSEAKVMFAEVEQKQQRMQAHRGDYHPDRLGTLVDLARCHYKLGDVDKSIELCKYTIAGFEAISGELQKEHPITTGLKVALGQLELLRVGAEGEARGARVSFPWILFREDVDDEHDIPSA